MSGGLKYRLVAFVLAIAGMFVLIAWTAQTSWRRTTELRDKLTAVQLQSFQIAEHVQQTIWQLNSLVLRYGVYHSTNDWTRFETVSKELDKWIDEERPILSTDSEKLILDLINTNYDHYMAAAHEIAAKVRSGNTAVTPLAEFADFEKQSHRILNLGSRLAKAHLDSMDSFLADSKKSLSYLGGVLLTSLVLLLLAVGGLAVVVYHELIAPLRLKLVESQALARAPGKTSLSGPVGRRRRPRNPQPTHRHQGLAFPPAKAPPPRHRGTLGYRSHRQ